MPLLTVIMPVYQVKPYLASCIKSILAQSFGDFELILIDDGSTDGSEQICDVFAEKDSRIRVIHQKNQGFPAHEMPDWLLLLESILLLQMQMTYSNRPCWMNA